MPLDGEYEPSPWGGVAEQVRQYEATGGQEGGTLAGVPCVILWTRGRKSGKVRKSPLIRVEHDGRYAVVASMGGAPTHPQWYLNLVDDPEVTLQDGPEVMDLRARTATQDEKLEWWPRCTAVWPDYDSYQSSTTRDIPVVLLEPRSRAAEPR
jgi:deazaflavin-dependent oxidoreductase (nitroreductase family)